MRGIVLAGGAGTRLYPVTRVASKQLQPVYDKPMVYYPIGTLMEAGVKEILLISTPDDLPRFRHLLGDGSQWGIQVSFAEQAAPRGIAEAFIIGAEFIGDSPVTLILGDNLFYGFDEFRDFVDTFADGALIFGYQVADPERYGVVAFDAQGRATSIEEKPVTPKSRFAIPGLYVFDAGVAEIARNLQPSGRGELEVTDVSREYLRQGRLRVEVLRRGVAWLDTGTAASLLQAANFVATLEDRQSLKIACLEEIALRQQFIDGPQFRDLVEGLPLSTYREYLEGIAGEQEP